MRPLTILLEQWQRDLRFAVRSIRRSPGFAAGVVLTLALGLGMNAVVCLATRQWRIEPRQLPDHVIAHAVAHPRRLLGIHQRAEDLLPRAPRPERPGGSCARCGPARLPPMAGPRGGGGSRRQGRAGPAVRRGKPRERRRIGLPPGIPRRAAEREVAGGDVQRRANSSISCASRLPSPMTGRFRMGAGSDEGEAGRRVDGEPGQQANQDGLVVEIVLEPEHHLVVLVGGREAGRPRRPRSPRAPAGGSASKACARKGPTGSRTSPRPARPVSGPCRAGRATPGSRRARHRRGDRATMSVPQRMWSIAGAARYSSSPLLIRKTWPSGWRTCISRTFQGSSVAGRCTSMPDFQAMPVDRVDVIHPDRHPDAFVARSLAVVQSRGGDRTSPRPPWPSWQRKISHLPEQTAPKRRRVCPSPSPSSSPASRTRRSSPGCRRRSRIGVSALAIMRSRS